jgi:WD40 repeat protein
MTQINRDHSEQLICGDHLSTYREHASAVTAVAWSPDGSKIASADGSGAIHVWSAR